MSENSTTHSLDAEHIHALKAILGPDGFSQAPDRMAPLLLEWRGKWSGHTPFLAMPNSTEALSAMMRYCHEHGICVTPQGGNTGLVGGQIPFGEVLISTQRLRKVRDIAPLDDTLVVEAGITLLEAQNLADEADRFSHCHSRQKVRRRLVE